MEENKYLVCPFCGGAASLDEGENGVTHSVTYSVICSCCGAKTDDFPNEEDAIKAWNNRHYRDYLKDILVQGVTDTMKNGKKHFYCQNCSHKDVCNKIDDPENDCEHFIDGSIYKKYASINQMFQPIFDWLNFHYPHGEVHFVVDGMSAKMYQEHGAYVASKQLMNFDFKKAIQNQEEQN